MSAVMRPIDHQSSSTDASLFTHPIAPNRLFARATLPRKVYDKISGQVHVVAPSIFAAFSDDFGKTWSPRPMLDTGGDQVDFRDLEKIVFSVSSDAKNGSFLECNADLECTLETRDIDEDATQHEMRKDAYLFQHVNAITLGEVSLTITGGKMCRRTTGSTQEEIVWTYASEVET